MAFSVFFFFSSIVYCLLQLEKVRERLQTTPFVEAISPEMQATFERLVKEESTGVRKPGGAKFAAGQLAAQLGFEGPSSFRKEQEALALERRKAVEGRDKAQEVVLEQVRLLPFPRVRERCSSPRYWKGAIQYPNAPFPV